MNKNRYDEEITFWDSVDEFLEKIVPWFLFFGLLYFASHIIYWIERS